MDAHMRTLFLISILLVSATTSRADDNVRTTRPLPKFTLQSVDDTKLSSTNFTGKTMIIWFFASWDKPCRQQLPALLELQKEYGTNDFTVLGVSLDSKGPVLYRQKRVGRNGKTFRVLKFRSMRIDAEKDNQPRWAAAKDDRVTRVGAVIRRFRIDEFPQLLNVLQGSMSLVGPRPERPFFVDQLVEQIPYYAVRHSVKPGVTGWAQVRYQYGATIEDAQEKLQYDLYYVKNHTLFLDLVVLFETVGVVLTGKGAR